MPKIETPCCRDDELRGKSLVDNILEIRKHYGAFDRRSGEWFDQLKCLSVRPGTEGKVLELAVREPSSSRARDFVAVSYSFTPADYSNAEPPVGVTVYDPAIGTSKKFKTRDIVLRRVLKYVKAVDTRYFWIDQECFDQDNEEERQAAMDKSMDVPRRVFGR
jgi:hypothetical protein